MKDFPQKLYSLRKERKISQSELGKMLGISNRAVSKWETGISVPSTENFIRLSEIFGVNISYFFEKTHKHTEPESAIGMEIRYISAKSSIYRLGKQRSRHTIR